MHSDIVRTLWEGGILQTKEQGLERSPLCQHLDFDVHMPELWGNKYVSLFKSFIYNSFYDSQSRLVQVLISQNINYLY